MEKKDLDLLDLKNYKQSIDVIDAAIFISFLLDR